MGLDLRERIRWGIGGSGRGVRVFSIVLLMRRDETNDLSVVCGVCVWCVRSVGTLILFWWFNALFFFRSAECLLACQNCKYNRILLLLAAIPFYPILGHPFPFSFYCLLFLYLHAISFPAFYE